MGNQSNAPTVPPFESQLLREIVSAVERRGKAIRYHGDLRCSHTVDDSVEQFKLEIKTLGRYHVRLCLWPDGVLWLSVSKPGPRRIGGWEHLDEFYSNVGGLDAHSVVELMEKTFLRPAQCRGYWPPLHDETQND